MSNKKLIQELKKLGSDISILYVEDNKGLLKKAGDLFENIFHKVFLASEAYSAIDIFKKNRPDIVITDIQMPCMNGLDMSVELKKIDSDIKIIVISAYNEIEYLHKAIDIGVYQYIVKPFSIDEIATKLLKCIREINYQKNNKILTEYQKDILASSTELFILFQDLKPILVNDNVLKFFAKDNFKDFYINFKNFGECFLEHFHFLYSEDGEDCLLELNNNYDKPFNVKIKDAKTVEHHFVLKFHKIKDNLCVLRLNDITELDLLKFFIDKTKIDENINFFEDINQEQLLNIFKLFRDNKMEITLHNFYKGLSITHQGLIKEVNEDNLILITTAMQQRAILEEKKIHISSELFPNDYMSNDIQNIDFDKKYVKFGMGNIVQSSPSSRSNIRLEPSKNYNISFSYHEIHFNTDISITDISIKSLLIMMPFLPIGLKEGATLNLKMNFQVHDKIIEIEGDAIVFRLTEHIDNIKIILNFELQDDEHIKLIEYISKRQVELINEFKDKG